MDTYTTDFYKTLPISLRNQIFEGAIQLASGFISFDSFSTGTSDNGGGKALVSRLENLEKAIPQLLSISAKLVIATGIISEPSGDQYTTAPTSTLSDEIVYERLEPPIQKIQIINESSSVADIDGKLTEIINSLE